MTMERNVTYDAYEYSTSFPFERSFDQWHYKRWTEENWVSDSMKTRFECLRCFTGKTGFKCFAYGRMEWVNAVRDILELYRTNKGNLNQRFKSCYILSCNVRCCLICTMSVWSVIPLRDSRVQSQMQNGMPRSYKLQFTRILFIGRKEDRGRGWGRGGRGQASLRQCLKFEVALPGISSKKGSKA